MDVPEGARALVASLSDEEAETTDLAGLWLAVSQASLDAATASRSSRCA